MTAKTILIPGTHGLENQWWKPGSFFFDEARIYGVTLGTSFAWSTALDGLLGKNGTWMEAAIDLKIHMRIVGLVDHNIVAHSHGGQVAIYAAAMGMKINTLMTVGTPVRFDMRKARRQARKNIKKWVHVHSNIWDIWQRFGSLFDGKISLVRRFKEADKNILIEWVMHGEDGLLDPLMWTDYELWKEIQDD